MEFSRQQYWSGLPFPSLRIFPTQGSNLGLPYCRQILYCLSHQGSPLIIYTDVLFVYSHYKFCVNWSHSTMKSGYNFTVLRKKCIFIIYIHTHTHTHTHTHIDKKIFMILNISSSIGLFFLYLLSWFLLSHLHLPWLRLRTQSQYEKILNDMFCCKSDVKTTWQEATSPWCRSYNAMANASCELLKKTSSE